VRIILKQQSINALKLHQKASKYMTALPNPVIYKWRSMLRSITALWKLTNALTTLEKNPLFSRHPFVANSARIGFLAAMAFLYASE